MCRWLFRLLVWGLGVVCADAQTYINTDSLLSQSRILSYSDPENSLKISDFLLQNSSNPDINQEIYIAKAQTYFLQQNYRQSLKELNLLYYLPENKVDEISYIESKLLLTALTDSLGLEAQSVDFLHESATLISKLKQSEEKQLLVFREALLKIGEKNDLGELFSIRRKLAEKSDKESGILLLQVNHQLAKAYLEKGEKDSAEIWFKKSLEKAPDSYFSGLSTIGLAELWSEKGKYSESNEILLRFIGSENKFKNTFLSSIYQRIAQNFYALQQPEQFTRYQEAYIKIYGQKLEDRKEARVEVLELAYPTNSSPILQQRIRWGFFLISGVLSVVWIYLIFRFRKLKKIKKKQMRELKNQEWLDASRKEIEARLQEEKNTPFIIPEKTETIILEKLVEFEGKNQFLNSDLSLASLAKELNSNTTYLSEIINKHKGKNFKSYINELRINYIVEKIKTDPAYRTYKISYLAEEAGFVSRTSFAGIFKSVTGISPSVFLESLENEHRHE